MSNDKQSMKLYTHEDVMHMLNCFHTYEMNVQLSLLKLTPIELPTDEEIRKQAINYSGFDNEFEAGAKWMRDKIQGDNK